MIDRAAFFAAIKRPLGLTSKARETVDAVLDEAQKRSITDPRLTSYILATVRRECGSNMLPVREGFKKTDAEARAFVKRQGYKYAKVVNGHVYYGRGLVQLTWDYNYEKMGDLLNLDLLADPDLALSPRTATEIMFEGMIRGSFTGKKLSQYFNKTTDDPKNARRIVNGLDHAAEIAGWHKTILAAMLASSEVVPEPAEKPAASEMAEEEREQKIMAIQQRLETMEYFPGKIDGDWGGGTAGALTGFLNDVPVDIDFDAPTSEEQFWVAYEQIDELTKKHEPSFRRPKSEERKNATAEDLSSVGNVTVKKTWWARAWGKVLTVFGGGGTAVGALSEATDKVKEPIDWAKEHTPWILTKWWFWFGLICAGGGTAVWYLTRQAEQGTVDDYRIGKLR